MNADVLTTRAADRIAVITLGSAKRIYFDAEMGGALTEALDGFAGDPNVRVSHCRGWRLPDRVAGGRPWSPSRCRRHAKAAAHHRNTSCTHAHPHGSAAESA